MSWYTRFNEVSTIKGDTLSDRYKTELQSSWDRYFLEAPNRQAIKIDGIDEIVVIQHLRYGEDKYDVQMLLTQNMTEAKYGSVLLWKTRNWLIINSEERAIDTHKSWKILLMQNFMVMKDSDSSIITEPCHITTKTAKEDGNTKVTLTNNRWVIRTQNNENTLKYYVNQRFLFNNKVAYRIVDINYSEFENQLSITLEPVQILPGDDLVNNIAINEIDISTIPTTGKNGIFFTEDKLKVSYQNIEKVEIYNYINDVIDNSVLFDFRIDGIDPSYYSIESETDNKIEIKSTGYYHVGKLVAINQATLDEYEIPLELVSPIG